jgi:hypothetical protein
VIETVVCVLFFVVEMPVVALLAADHDFEVVEFVVFGVRGCCGDFVGVVEEAVGACVGWPWGPQYVKRLGWESCGAWR